MGLLQFAFQEPKSEPEIKKFAVEKYGAKFVMMSKICVNGSRQHPVFSFLTAQPGCEGVIAWNFKGKCEIAVCSNASVQVSMESMLTLCVLAVLISRDGKTVQRFSKKTSELEDDIAELCGP